VSPVPPPPPPSSLPLSSNETVRMTFTPPAPEEVSGAGFGNPAPAAAMASTGGILYEGPPPATAGGPAYGGTVYSGPPPGTVRPPTFGMPMGDVGVGDLLNQTFSVYFANFVPFALLTAVALSPLFIMQGIVLSAKLSSSSLALLSLIPLLLGAIFCPQIATGAITYGVFQQLRQKETSISDCLSQGLSALPRVLGLAIVQGILVSLGALACGVPAIILSVRWAVSVPATVTERTGATESMSRSSFLTEGFRWQVFGFLFVLIVLNVGLSVLAALAATGNPTMNVLLSGLASIFTTGVGSTGSAVLYYRLRSAKESIDVDQIASVFA
jgi:hypothetical protein